QIDGLRLGDVGHDRTPKEEPAGGLRRPPAQPLRRGSRLGELLLHLGRHLPDASALGVLAAAEEPALLALAQLHRRVAVWARLRPRDGRHRLLRRRSGQPHLVADLLRHRPGAAARRVARATQERPSRPLLDRHRLAALVAGDAGHLRLHRPALLIDVLGVLAAWIARAGQERPAPPLAQHHRLAALLAGVFRRPGREDRLAVLAEVHGRLAFGVTRAAQELAAAEALLTPQHHAAARRALEVRLDGLLALGLTLGRLDVLAALSEAGAADEGAAGLLAEVLDEGLAAPRAVLAGLAAALGRHLGVGLFQRLAERPPELVEDAAVGLLRRLDLVQLLLEVHGERQVHDVGEVLD